MPPIKTLGVLTGALLLTTTTTASATPDPVLPAPTGPHRVGSVDLHLVDETRPDPWVPGTTRELVVTLRYPAPRTDHPRTAFLPPGAAAVVAEVDAARLGVDPASLDYGFPTHARANAPVLGGRHPVVLYSPGAGESRAFGTALTEQLASEGYVVVAIDHTHEAPAVEFPDGRVARRAVPRQTAEVLRAMIDTRVRDAQFVLDRLEVLTRGGNPDAAGRELPHLLGRSLDLSRVGAFGHSGGGFTAAELMRSDRRVDAGADLDGSMTYSRSALDFGRVAHEGLDRPFLLMSAGDHSAATDPSWRLFLGNHRSWVRQLHLPAGEHFSYTDHQVLLHRAGVPAQARAGAVGTVDPLRSTASQRAYLGAHFDLHLRHRPTRLFDGPSPAHPDVVFPG
ncbi:alpha/beta hydrolase family protein [Saccharothrix syringae]|uniref:Lipase n=1 Tax=Saccharothrix syringae TaxID=103733 RepID=A0A5Q0GX76_SACSY|nr:lipase [Saccharothrix syringae]QFZ18134.1 lipase [Saccharothrix syringae]